MGSHHDAFGIGIRARKRGIHITYIIHFDLRADGLHSALILLSGLNRCRRQGVTGDSAVTRVTEF